MGCKAKYDYLLKSGKLHQELDKKNIDEINR